MHGRTPKGHDTPENHIWSFFPSSALSASSTSTRPRHRGFQPTEVNRTKSRVETEAVSTDAQALFKAGGLESTSTAANIPAKVDTETDKYNSKTAVSPHRDVVIKASSPTDSQSRKSSETHDSIVVPTAIKSLLQSEEPQSHEVAVTSTSHGSTGMNAANLKSAHLPLTTTISESNLSETSSIQIITSEQPQKSCWSKISTPMETPVSAEGGWNNRTYPIDLPWYRRPDYGSPSPKVDFRKLPRYKWPAAETSTSPDMKKKENGSNPSKKSLMPATNSFSRQVAHLQQSDSLVVASSTKKAENASPEKLVNSSPEVSSKLLPHLRAKVTENSKPQLNKEMVDVTEKVGDAQQISELPSNLQGQFVPSASTLRNIRTSQHDGALNEATAAPQHAIQSVSNATKKSVVNEASGKDGVNHESRAGSNSILPHLRKSTPKVPAKTTEAHYSSSEVAETVESKNNSHTQAFPAQPTVLQDVTKSRLNVKTTAPSDGVNHTNATMSAVRKGKMPENNVNAGGSALGFLGWDGKPIPAPLGEDWAIREQHDPDGKERQEVVKVWMEDNATEFGTRPTGIEEEPASLANTHHPETLPHPDEFNQAKRHLSASDAVKTFEAKRSASSQSTPPEFDRMTKEERREFRRFTALVKQSQAIPPNDHAPAANIYLRPAEMRDMPQVTLIHNYYDERSACATELAKGEEIYWRTRFQEAWDERNPFLVAVHMGQKATKDDPNPNRRFSETIVGFAFAADYGLQHTVWKFTVELELWVHHDYLHQGIGRTMLDRMLGALDPGYNLLECAPLLGKNLTSRWSGGGCRIVKTILVHLHHNNINKDTLKWKKEWLTNNEFTHGGTLPHIGFKFGKR